MFPKAYIFYTVPNANLYLNVRTPKTSNVELADYNPYFSHHPDVRQMWEIAKFQHPQIFYQNVIVVQEVGLKSLTYAHLIKDNEAIYCVQSEWDLIQLESIAKDIAVYGPDISRFEQRHHVSHGPPLSGSNSNQKQHDLMHELIHRFFVKTQGFD